MMEGEVTWEEARGLTLEEILARLSPNALHHWRLRDNDGSVVFTITLARDSAAQKVDEIVRVKFTDKVVTVLKS